MIADRLIRVGVLGLLAATGCVRTGFVGELADGGPDSLGRTDGSCAATEFGTPARVPNVNSTGNDDDWLPSLSADGLELFFSSWRPGGQGRSDLWHTTRSSTSDDFSTPTNVAELNSSASEFNPWITADGRTLLFVSNRDNDHYAIYLATRSGPGGQFSAPAELMELRTSSLDDDWGPVLVEDGRRLYFSSKRAGGVGDLDIWTTTRANSSSPFGPVSNLGAINSPAEDFVATISRDGKELYFSSNRPGGKGLRDLYVVAMAAADQPRGAPQNLSALNTSFDDIGATLTPDGRGILFNRDTLWDGGRDADIWIAGRSCMP